MEPQQERKIRNQYVMSSHRENRMLLILVYLDSFLELPIYGMPAFLSSYACLMQQVA
jgi:hypothetical protein